jgi:SAM-dependent methyltransferase
VADTTTSAPSRWDANGEEAQNLRRRAESLWNRDYFASVLVPLLAVPDGGRVVDVGTGFGALAFLLSSARPDLRIVGIDPETGLIEGAREAAAGLGLSRLEFVVGSGETLPFPDGTFDLVMCQTVLTHVPNARAVLVEMSRVVKAGGTVLAAEWIDRANMAMPFDNASEFTVDEASDAFGLTKAYSRGRFLLGRGDDAAGVTAPMLAVEAGLEVIDVRLNDRVSWAVPPYDDDRQRVTLDEGLEWAKSPDSDDDFRTWARENIEAAGKTSADAERYMQVLDSPAAKGRWRAAIEARCFSYVGSNAMLLTIARKPGEPAVTDG